MYGFLNIENIHVENLNNYIISTSRGNWLISSVLYASYNSILLIPILITIKDYIVRNKNIKYVSILTSLIIIVLLMNIYLFLINVDVDITQLEMPAIYAIQKISYQIKNIYGIIILISIFTTAISLGMSFIKNTSKNQKQYNTINILACLSAIVFSKIGFSKLVNSLYPILGILGLIQILQILTKNIAKK